MNTSSKSYTESLPKKRMGAGCLFFDEQGRVLLVRPTYKPGWEIPGGIVERYESPKQCCRREVLEEIGLARPVGELLVVDYNPETDVKSESLMFVFDGGVLTRQDVEAIHLHCEELSEYRFFGADSLPAEMTLTLRRRVIAAARQAARGKGAYLENQEVV
jgi:ADP-ribose pyrophosphatase YjhB (NUDIX family)